MKREMKKDSPEYLAFIAVWEFWKKYGTPEGTDKYWQEVNTVGSADVALNPKWRECWDLSSEMFKAVVNALDARCRSMKQYGDEKHGYEVLQADLEKANTDSAEKIKRIRELEKRIKEMKGE